MSFFSEHLLSLLIFWPLLGAVLVCLLPSGEKGKLSKLIGLSVLLIEFVLSLFLFCDFQNTGVVDQYMVSVPWIPTWNIWFRLGIDGMSLLLIVLSTFLMPLALLGTWNSVSKMPKLYMASLLTLLSGMVGAFTALDLFLFYVFWEVMLVPMYILIGVWGGARRQYAAVKFFIFTMAGSVLMLVAILYLYFQAGQTFNLLELYNYQLRFSTQLWVFLAFALAFAIKVPLLPFHTWLPDAHVEAPTIGSVILAGVLLKMGVYGFIRFAIPLFPHAMIYLQPYLIAVAAIGVVFGALVAMVQTDIKKLVAYSSVSHMGVVMLGVFSLNTTSLTGGMYQMLSHAISTGGLFLLIGMLYDRTHTRAISDYSGLAKLMPLYVVMFLIITFSSIAVPLTNGFVGEFLTLVGSFSTSPVWTSVAATGVIFGAVYMLWLVRRVFFGAVVKTPGAEKDLNLREILVMGALVVLVFVMGIRPQPFLNLLERSAETVIFKLEDQQEHVVQNF